MNSIRGETPRSAAVAGVLAALCLAIGPACARNIVQEWSQVQAPPPPVLKAVRIAPASTAWYLTHAPRVSQHTKPTAVDRIRF